MPSHFLYQQPPSKPLIVQHPSQMRGEQGQPERVEVELHTRQVIADGPDARMACSCGYLSVAYADRFMAESKGCPIEYEMAVSAERRRRMYSSSASLSVSDPVSRR